MRYQNRASKLRRRAVGVRTENRAIQIQIAAWLNCAENYGVWKGISSSLIGSASERCSVRKKSVSSASPIYHSASRPIASNRSNALIESFAR
jgi:hypothetical protein